jgi:hypothetical protein
MTHGYKQDHWRANEDQCDRVQSLPLYQIISFLCLKLPNRAWTHSESKWKSLNRLQVSMWPISQNHPTTSPRLSARKAKDFLAVLNYQTHSLLRKFICNFCPFFLECSSIDISMDISLTYSGISSKLFSRWGFLWQLHLEFQLPPLDFHLFSSSLHCFPLWLPNILFSLYINFI